MTGDDRGAIDLSLLADDPPVTPPAAARDRYAADGSCAHPALDLFDRCRLCGLSVEDRR